MAAKIFHPLLALIASASNNELARYVEFLKEENKILRARVPGQIHTRTDERSRLVKLGKTLGQAIEDGWRTRCRRCSVDTVRSMMLDTFCRSSSTWPVIRQFSAPPSESDLIFADGNR